MKLFLWSYKIFNIRMKHCPSGSNNHTILNKNQVTKLTLCRSTQWTKLCQLLEVIIKWREASRNTILLILGTMRPTLTIWNTKIQEQTPIFLHLRRRYYNRIPIFKIIFIKQSVDQIMATEVCLPITKYPFQIKWCLISWIICSHKLRTKIHLRIQM
jgi:hypothetical protein